LGYFKNIQDTRASIILLTTELQPVSYFVEAPGIRYYHNGALTADNAAIVNLNDSVVVSSHVEQDKGIYLKTVSDRVTVIGQTRSSTTPSSDTFLALSITNFCAVQYIYYGISVRRNMLTLDNVQPSTSIILIVGTVNNTAMKLTVTQSVNISVGSVTTELITGREYSFVINRLQTVFIESLEDLTGTKIVTNNQVSVLSGHQAGNVPQTTKLADHLIEQIPPIEFWGKVYYTAPLATRVSYTIKILVAYNSTNVTTYCNNTMESFAINEGKFIIKSFMLQEYCAIHSDKKILVVQFSHGYLDDRNGDPMMTLVPAVNHYLNQLDFSTIHSSDSYKHYINIIVMEQYYQPSMMYLIAGGVNRSLASQDWVPIVVNNITESYATQVNISEGIVRLIHANKMAMMTTVVYGFDSVTKQGYGHPGGLNLTSTGRNIHIPDCIQACIQYVV